MNKHKYTRAHTRFMIRWFQFLSLSLRSKVGHVDSMMECLLQPDQYLITAIDPTEQAYFTA